MLDFLIKLQTIDRRWIYLAVGLACVVPFIVPMRLTVRPSQETIGVYKTIENLPRDKAVLIDSGWDAGSLGENMGQAEVIVEHLFRRRVPFVVINIGGSPQGPQFMNAVIDKIHKRYPDRKYGIDWVNLGYNQVGGWVTMTLAAKDLHKAFPRDYKGTKVNELPLMRKTRNIDDISLICCINYSPSEEWIGFIHGVYGTPIAFACAGIQSTSEYRYIPSKQLVGLLVSARGSAEYDVLLHPNKSEDRTSKGTELIVPLTYGHLVIIFGVVIGNIGYLAERRRKRLRRWE
jgi:hypothetical protein